MHQLPKRSPQCPKRMITGFKSKKIEIAQLIEQRPDDSEFEFFIVQSD